MVINSYLDIDKEDSSLRTYQQKAKREIFESWDEVDSVMFQMPTGTGKTRLFTSIISDINKYSIRRKEAVKILIVAHRTELINQIDKSLEKYKVPHNVIAGGKEKNYKYPVSVASIQTITNARNIKEAKKLKVQFVIIDEAHHALAKTYKKLWDLYPDAKRLGVTATPWRMNHQSFTDLFDKLVLSMPVKDFIRQGYLAPYKYFSLKNNSDIQRTIDDIELDRFGEYKESSMEEKMDIGSIRAQLLDSYLSLADGKKGIIYAINIVHAKHICEEYKQAGYNAVSIDSKTPAAKRNELVNKFKRGLIDIIVNVDIFSEGFDCPDIEFIQLARPTRSLVKYLQQVGRGLRTTENKQNCVILDNVGMYSRFGLPDARRHWRHHFLGKQIDEEPPKVMSKGGSGRHRYVDMTEGTEDMELIQDSYEEVENEVEVEVEERISASVDLFPIFGVTLGKTTCDQAEKLGGEYIVDEDTGAIYMVIENVQFEYTNNILDWLYWNEDYRDFPDSWKSMGFSWENSYDEWLSVFSHLGYRIEIDTKPSQEKYNGKTFLNASFTAVSSNGNFSFYLSFGNEGKGYQTSSPNTLSFLSIRCHMLSEESKDDNQEEKNVEAFDPMPILDACNYKDDNFIFWFNDTKKIYECYIQDDKYYIISELTIDKSKHRVHRTRVGKIPAQSWMFWQMEREKVDNLKSIVHYGGYYSVFHYRVLGKDNKAKDKFFDYKGREIDSSEVVKEKVEKAKSEGTLKNFIDVPISKATFKAELISNKIAVYRTMKGETRPIAIFSAFSDFGKHYFYNSTLLKRRKKELEVKKLGEFETDNYTIFRSDDDSFTAKCVIEGKKYLCKYNLHGELVKRGTISVGETPKKVLITDSDIHNLQHVFDKKATSYKYFWFLSILQIYKETQEESISYRKILVRIIANAWKYVFVKYGRFPSLDQLPVYIRKIKSITGLDTASDVSAIEEKIEEYSDSSNIFIMIRPLLNNVPYRFLSPWITFTNKDDIKESSQRADTRCIYKIQDDSIVIHKMWREYLFDHYKEISVFVEKELEAYLKIGEISEDEAFYYKQFPSLSSLLKEMKKQKQLNVVKTFFEKYDLPIKDIVPSDIMMMVPKSKWIVKKDRSKSIKTLGDKWTLKFLDELLSR